MLSDSDSKQEIAVYTTFSICDSFKFLFLGFYESSFVSVPEMPFKYQYNLKDLSSLKTCGICGRNFTKTSHLNRHMFIHTGEKPFKCSVCNVSFSKKDNLTRHNLIHTGEKPHTCFICGKTYARKDKYQEHLRSHNMVNWHLS